MSFGARLTQARKDKGLTQTDLGRGLGTDGDDASKAVVYGWEKDQHFPRVDQLKLICERLGISADLLLFGRTTELGLLPEVASLAREITELPTAQRDWVLGVVRQTIEAAKATIRVNGNGSTLKDSASEAHHETPSPKRRRAA
jgi:transcriptional regulator with XRE-family HTH domain